MKSCTTSEQPQILRAFGFRLWRVLRFPRRLKLTRRRRTVPRVMIVRKGKDRHAAPCNLSAHLHPTAQLGAPINDDFVPRLCLLLDSLSTTFGDVGILSTALFLRRPRRSNQPGRPMQNFDRANAHSASSKELRNLQCSSVAVNVIRGLRKINAKSYSSCQPKRQYVSREGPTPII
jgi:hypothetical protein